MGCNEIKGKNYPVILFVFEDKNEDQKNYCIKLRDNFYHKQTVRYEIKSYINSTFSIKLKIKETIYDIQTTFSNSEEDMKRTLQKIYNKLDEFEPENQELSKIEENINLEKGEVPEEIKEEKENFQEIKEEKEKFQEIKKRTLQNQKKIREKDQNEIKNEKEKNEKINEILEDMCIYGNITKKEIKEEKKKNPEKFIESSEALKLEDEDQNLFALGLISTNLENMGIETAIEKNSDDDKEDEGLTSFQFITNGMIGKKKYDLHFEFGEKRNEELLNSKEEFEKFKKNLKLKLSKDYNIPTDKIIVTFPQKGSCHVQVIFQSDEFNDLDINEFKNKFKNDPEFKELSNLKDIHTDMIVGGCKLTKGLLDSEGNRSSGWAVGECRGGKPYDPPLDWIGIGLKVKDKYGDNIWIGMDNSPGEWCVAYHGIASGQSSDNVKRVTGIIAKTTFKKGGGQAHASCPDQFHPGNSVGEGVYCTPTIKTAEDKYAGISEINGVKYKTVIMVRVKPEAIRHCDICSDSRAPYNYWVVNGTPDEIRPYRILYKKC